MEVPAFDLGGEIRETVLSESRATLGAARYSALESTRGIDSIDRAFDGFGSSPRQITISRIANGQPGAADFRLTDGRRTAGGIEFGQGSSFRRRSFAAGEIRVARLSFAATLESFSSFRRNFNHSFSREMTNVRNRPQSAIPQRNRCVLAKPESVSIVTHTARKIQLDCIQIH